MACCGGKGSSSGDETRLRSFPVELFRFLLDGLLSALWLLIVNVASLFSRPARARRAEFSTAVLTDLGQSASALLDAPFLVDGKHRCRLSAHLYPRSEALAGLVYRYFYLAIFTALTISIVATFVLARTLLT